MEKSEEKLFILDLLKLNTSEKMYSEKTVINIIKQVLKMKSTSPDKAIIDEAIHEREALFQAFDQIRASFKGRHWLMEGRGCYPYDDERYKQEVRYIMDEFEEINSNLWKQINSKSFEYRDMIKAPLEAIIEKYDELVEHVGGFDPNHCKECKRLLKELQALKAE